MRIYRPPPLSVAQQYLALRSNPICVGEGQMRCGSLTWEYEVQPSLLSRTYDIRISYSVGKKPQVLVRNPSLVELARPRRLPHVYQQDPTLLCLYRSTKGDWTARMHIAKTIVPWTALWLFFFEAWLASNEWKGGGEHPSDGDSRRRDLDPEER